MKIVVLDAYSCNPGDITWNQLNILGEVIYFDRTLPTEVIQRIGNADVVLTNKVVINKSVIDSAPCLKYIGVLATGFNVVDVKYAHDRGVIVTNIPAYSTDSVAQMVFAHLLNIYSRVDNYANQNRNGRWESSLDFCYWDMPHHELSGNSIGIIGYGNIGSRVGAIAHEFGMRVYAYTSKSTNQLPFYVNSVSMNQLFKECDIVTLHCPLIKGSTFHLINAETLKLMKYGAVLINTGRGPLVDEEAVVEALNNGRLSAYAADVMSSEPPAINNKLVRHPHAFITPHIAWATVEARKRLINIAADNIKAFIEGYPINVVNN